MGLALSQLGNQGQRYNQQQRSPGGSITGNRYGYNTPGNSTPGGLITSGPYAGYNNVQGLGVNGQNPGLGGRGGGIDYRRPIRTITGPGVFEGP